MSVKLKKELQQVQQKEWQELKTNNIVDKANQLLIEYDHEQSKILEDAGFQLNIGYEAKLKEDFKRTKASEEIYNRPTFTGKQIKELCNIYDLRLLPTSKYRGAVDVDVADKIKEFCDTNNLPITSSDLYILAPTSSFQTVDEIIPKDKDPILFYRTDKDQRYWGYEAKESETFAQIHNWGNDFTDLRKLRFLFDPSRNRNDDQTSSNRVKTILLCIGLLFVIGACATGFMPFILFSLFIGVITLFNFLFLDTYTLNDDQWNSEKISK
jgi:hypothetical protein